MSLTVNEMPREYLIVRRSSAQLESLMKSSEKQDWKFAIQMIFTFFGCLLMRIYVFNLPFLVQRPLDIKNRPRIPIPDEDPYSTAGGSSGSSGFGASGSFAESSGRVASAREQLMMQAAKQSGNKRSEKPPKLPPRDIYPQALRASVLKQNKRQILTEPNFKLSV